MNEQDYLRESARTLSSSYHKELVTPNELLMMFGAAKVGADWADNLKKALFYGKTYKPKTSPHSSSSLTLPENPDLLHAILGIYTEAFELLEHYFDVMQGKKPLDEVNLDEEVGDLLWYCARIWRATGKLPSASMALNINKLQKRFPDRFSEEKAKERDLFAERQVLEGKTAND